ncbi:unnamed protein product [Prorocentrum cordatum]|uniref:Uncharacterized protein n=1 Tax=Prorocentrum cordatum TaxID=2364126 RepID=A0ABN9X872_9DINO|nr:unnamed protein product [Polarella glacialis]|mmetsp:Transcript_60266/g.156424  ORF Transcript_60266/g.156424 Transcript_60266/m.156424 type:complete len:120 (-) Transcript_60266:117-476(-)
MDLKDIPDRWKRFHPDNPPYRYFPNRTRKQTMIYSWLAIAGCTAFGYLLAEAIEWKNSNKPEMYNEYAKSSMSLEHHAFAENQKQAFTEILMRARRQRLGLPAQAHGSVEIKDPFGDDE